ncbi:MAG: hypothetical protein LAQ30_04490 [Acidobacteriia bacterium]|nr:hypothetical protein [Terriglobia bacterium]
MSIIGYFERPRPELRIRRTGGFGSASGARGQGDVLTGKASREQAVRVDALRAGPVTGRVAASLDYDPVPAYHLGLPNEPSPKNEH